MTDILWVMMRIKQLDPSNDKNPLKDNLAFLLQCNKQPAEERTLRFLDFI